MKKILTLIIAISSIFMFASCGADTTTEPDARATLTSFMDSLITLDIDQALNYTNDKGAIDSTLLDDLNLEKVLTDTLASNPNTSAYADLFTPMFDSIISKVANTMSYQINDYSGSGNEYSYNVDITVPDMDATGNVEALLTDAMGEHLSEEGITKIATDLFTSGKITLDSSESDIFNAVIEKLLPDIEAAITNIDIKTKVIPATFVITDDSGEWKINVEKSNMD